MAPKELAEPALTLENLVTALREVSGAAQHNLVIGTASSLPTFGGDSDVEQVIGEFEDVAIIAKWPVPVQVLQLRACLTGQAKNFSLGPDEEYIISALGMTAYDARDRLLELLRDRRTSLQNHANTIERLAQFHLFALKKKKGGAWCTKCYSKPLITQGYSATVWQQKYPLSWRQWRWARPTTRLMGPHGPDFTANQVI